MKINDVAEKTGISPKNIRFYEKEGLICPARNISNQYREYSDADIQVLKDIKLFRKLGIPLRDIKAVQQGTLALQDCLARHETQLQEQVLEMNQAIEFCARIRTAKETYPEIDAEKYLQQIEKMEAEGIPFFSIIQDFITRAKDTLPQKPSLFFEPDVPVLDRRTFTDELIKYCRKEHKDLTIIKESMEPIVEIDGQRYLCMLETPRMLNLPIPLFSSHSYGFKFVYLYLY